MTDVNLIKENLKKVLTKEKLTKIGIGTALAIAMIVGFVYAWYCGDKAYAATIEVVDVVNIESVSEDSFNVINENIESAVTTIMEEKEAAAKAEEEAAAAESYNNYSYSSNNYVASSWSGGSAKDFIIYHESRGDYTATNGRYYGAYQLDISYLNGDLSPENQDRVAEEYVNGRYGGWEGAMAHFQSHGWY